MGLPLTDLIISGEIIQKLRNEKFTSQSDPFDASNIGLVTTNIHLCTIKHYELIGNKEW